MPKPVSPPAAGERTRRRIVSVAAKAFRKHGIDGIGVRDVMKLAGLTPGSFYFHFRDKEQLFAEASREAFTATTDSLFAAIDAAPRAQRLHILIEGYLSSGHRDGIDAGCTMAALGADVARRERRLRRDFGTASEVMVDRVAACFDHGDEGARQRRARLLMASMAGVMIASRVVPDKEASDALLADARKAFQVQFAGS